MNPSRFNTAFGVKSRKPLSYLDYNREGQGLWLPPFYGKDHFVGAALDCSAHSTSAKPLAKIARMFANCTCNESILNTVDINVWIPQSAWPHFLPSTISLHFLQQPLAQKCNRVLQTLL